MTHKNPRRLEIDSWNEMQRALLRDFLDAARPGDKVVFDRKLAEINGRPGEILDDRGLNSWVCHVANETMLGLSEERMNEIAAMVILKTEYLQASYPEYDALKPPEPPETQAELEETDDAEVAAGLALEERPKTDAEERAEWARIRDQFTGGGSLRERIREMKDINERQRTRPIPRL